VWDDHGRAKLDDDGINAWQWCFSTGHEFAGAAVLDNGLVRVELDAGLAVEAYMSGDDSWSSVGLGASDWELDDWSLSRIGPSRVEAACRFRDPTAGSEYWLDLRLPRGYERPQWVVAQQETPPTPSGLQDLLDPVADRQDYRAGAVQGLVDRGEVSRG